MFSNLHAPVAIFSEMPKMHATNACKTCKLKDPDPQASQAFGVVAALFFFECTHVSLMCVWRLWIALDFVIWPMFSSHQKNNEDSQPKNREILACDTSRMKMLSLQV